MRDCVGRCFATTIALPDDDDDDDDVIDAGEDDDGEDEDDGAASTEIDGSEAVATNDVDDAAGADPPRD